MGLKAAMSKRVPTTATWSPDRPVPCSQDPELWASVPGDLSAPDRIPLPRLRALTVVPRTICKTRCPLQIQCREAAMDREGGVGPRSRWGIWGGLLPQERDLLYRKRLTERKSA